MGRPKGSKNKPKVLDNTPPISNTTQNKKTDKVDKLLTNTRKSVKPTVSTPQGVKTVKEISTTLTKQERVNEMFATTKAMLNALQLVDLSKTENRTFQTYSRETLRTYLKSPKSYESQIRNLSRYLYRLCYEYRRICNFYARMICGDAFNITPLVDLTQPINNDEIVQKYYETLIRWQRLDFKDEITKLLLVAWREDTVYAYVYDDSDQEGGTCFYQILDGDYCRISSIEAGVFRFAFDFSYFRSHEAYLEYWDSEFKSKYEAYQVTALQYYNKFAEKLPECVNACLSPIPIEPIEFKDLNTTDDTDMISSSLSNLFKRIGGVILDNDKTGSTIYEAQIIADMEIAHSTLVPQINRYLNLYFNYVIGTDHASIKYLEGVCPYTRKSKRKEYLESAQNGFAKMKIGILDGDTQLEQLSALYLENALGLSDLMTPLSTSYTQTSSGTDPVSGGRPESDAADLTDSGSDTREQDKNNM